MIGRSQKVIKIVNFDALCSLAYPETVLPIPIKNDLKVGKIGLMEHHVPHADVNSSTLCFGYR